MLAADIELTNLMAPVDVLGGSIFVGDTWITPFAHRLLHTLVVESGERIAIACLERFPGDPHGIEHVRVASDRGIADHLDRIRAHLLDWSLLGLDRRSGTISWQASQVHAAPVYLCATETRVRIDWDCSRLLRETGYAAIDRDAMMAHLAGCAPYSARTLVSGLYRSVAGATLIAQAGRIETRLPPPVAAPGAQELAPDAQPEHMLFDTIGSLLSARDLDARRTAVEISGGMDSALVGLAAAERLGSGLLSYGAQFDGTMGEAQRYRRELLCRHGGFQDMAFPAARFLPFSQQSPRRERFGIWPQDENYPEMFAAIFDLLAKAGIDTLTSGFGGDELYTVYAGEEPDEDGGTPVIEDHPFLTEAGRAAAARGFGSGPAGIVADTSWLSTHGRAQRLLRRGIWPIYPYINPVLARYVAALPLDYRRDRTLLRRTLTARLGDPLFERDYVKESFRDVAVAGITGNRDWLRDVVRRSPILDLGLLDRGRIFAALDSDIDTLPRHTFGFLFILLSACCFFDEQS
jgi:asparagine synthase (glutamine-hydrolysing)